MSNPSPPAHQALSWLAEGGRLFMQQPLIWAVLLMIFLLLNVLSTVTPLGGAVLTLLTPAFMGGLLVGCSALRQGEELELSHLIAGFDRIGHLALQGILLLIGQFMLVLPLLLLGGLLVASTDIPQLLVDMKFGDGFQMQDDDFKKLFDAFGSERMMVFALGMMVFGYLQCMLLIFSNLVTCLIIFSGEQIGSAIGLAAQALRQRLGAYLLLALCVVCMLFLASITVIGLLAAFPIFIGACYAAYCSLFPQRPAQLPLETAEVS